MADGDVQKTYSTKISLDVNSASLTRLKAELRQVNAEWKNSIDTAKIAGNFYQATSNKVSKEKDNVRLLSETLEKQKAALKGVTGSTKADEAARAKYEQQIGKTNIQLQKHENALKKAQKAESGFASGVFQLKDKMKSEQEASDSEVRSLRAAGKEYQANRKELEQSNRAYKENKQLMSLQSNELEKLKTHTSELEGTYNRESATLRRLANSGKEDTQAYREQASRVAGLKEQLNELATDEHKQTIAINNTSTAMAKNASKSKTLSRSYGGLTEKSAKTADGLKKIGHSAGEVGDKFLNAGRMTIGATATIGAGIGYGITQAAKLQNSYVKTGNLAKTGGEKQVEVQKNINAMWKQGANLSKKYGVSQSQIAAGNQELIKRGYSTTQALAAQKTMTNAAVASGENYNDVVKNSATAIEAFGLRSAKAGTMAKHTKDTVNEMAYAADMTATDFNGMGIAMSYAGPPAHMLGVNVSQTAAAIGILSNNGLEADKAGTGLRKMFQSLEKPTKQGIAALHEMHLSNKNLYTDSGKLKPLPEVFKELNAHTAGWSKEKKGRYFNMLFGTTGQNAASILTNQYKQLGKLNKETEKAPKKNYVEKLAEKNMQSAQKQFQIAKSNLQAIGIMVGKDLLPSVNKVLKAATHMMGAFDKMPRSVKNLAGMATVAVGAFAPLMYVVGSVSKGIQGTAAGVSWLLGHLPKVSSETNDVVSSTNNIAGSTKNWKTQLAGLSKQVAVVWALNQAINAVKVSSNKKAPGLDGKKVTGWSAGIQRMMWSLGNGLLKTVSFGHFGAKDLSKLTTGWAKSLRNWIKHFKFPKFKMPEFKMSKLRKIKMPKISNPFKGFTKFWSSAWKKTTKQISKDVRGISKFIGKHLNLGKAWNGLSKAWSKTWRGLKKTIGKDTHGVAKWVGKNLNIPKMMSGFGKSISKGIKSIQRTYNNFTKWLGRNFKKSNSDLKKSSQSGMKLQRSIAKTGTDFIHGRWIKLGKDVKNIVKNLWSTLKNLFKAGYDFVNKLTGGRLGKMVNLFSEAWKTISKGWKSTWDGISSFFKGIWNNIGKLAHDGMKGIIGVLNLGIKGIDGVIHMFGGKTTAISPIKFATGTGMFSQQRRPITKPTIAQLNDGTDSPETGNREMAILPNGNTFVPKEKNWKGILPAGTEILNASETAMLSSLNLEHFAKGTGLLGKISNAVKKAIGKATGIAKTAVGIISNPTGYLGGLLKKPNGTGAIMSNFASGFFNGLKGQAGQYWSGMWDMAKKLASEGASSSKVLQYAVSHFHGDPYVLGGKDCSWMVQAAFKHFGVDLPRTTNAMITSSALQKIGKNVHDSKPGDIVLFGGTGSSAAKGHVGIVSNPNTGTMFNQTPPHEKYSSIAEAAKEDGLAGFFRAKKLKGADTNNIGKTMDKLAKTPLEKIVVNSVGMGFWKWIQKHLSPIFGAHDDHGIDGFMGHLSGSEKAAKKWIAMHESSGRWIGMSSNGHYGMFQLDPSYLHGDFSHKHQSEVADKYVAGRYGSWRAAQRHWMKFHWYSNGGMVNQEQIAHLAENNKPEMVIPMDRAKRPRAIGLMQEVLNEFSKDSGNSNGNPNNGNNSSLTDRKLDALIDGVQSLIEVVQNKPTGITQNDVYGAAKAGYKQERKMNGYAKGKFGLGV